MQKNVFNNKNFKQSIFERYFKLCNELFRVEDINDDCRST